MCLTALLLSLSMVWSYVVPAEPLHCESYACVELQYGGEIRTVEIPEGCISLPIARLGPPTRLNMMLTPDDHTVRQLSEWVDELAERSGNTEDRDKAYIASGLVSQNISYEWENYEASGITIPFDHWKLPWETVRDGKGDCEDTAILLASILLASGVECALTVETDHVSVAVYGEDGYTVAWNGRTYGMMDLYEANYPGSCHMQPYMLRTYGWDMLNMLELAGFAAAAMAMIYYFIRRDRDDRGCDIRLLRR